MNERVLAAESALVSAVETVRSSGLEEAVHALASEVWSTNLARWQPEAHGDTTRSLGTQCYENFRELALRRWHGSDWMAAEDRWNIPGLMVSTPQGVLTMALAGLTVVTKKVPYSQGRAPQWDRFPDWDLESRSRHDLARDNARVLGGNALRHPSQCELALGGDAALSPGRVRNLMLVWAGDHESGATSAWLTVPVAWPDMHFAAIERLWHDDVESAPVSTAGLSAAPAQPVVEPVVRLKRPAERQEEG